MRLVHLNIKSRQTIKMRFKNKTVIVTGGGGGIGLATAKRFAAEGAKIVLADFNLQLLQKAEDELNAAGAEGVWISQCDVSNEQQVEATVTGETSNNSAASM